MSVRPLVVAVVFLSCLNAQNTKSVPLPLSFEVNRGQTDAEVQYLVRGGRQTIFLTPNRAVLSLVSPGSSTPGRFQSIRTLRAQKLQTAAIRMNLRNSRQPDSVEPLDPLPGKVNYLIGNDPSRWHTDIPTYARIAYHGVYPGVDLVYYGTEGRLEYDFIAQAGANTSAIQVQFEGADRIRLSDEGDLILDTAAGQVRWKKPYVYQEDQGVRRPIAANYRLTKDHGVEFALARYNRKLPVVIDPTLVYSTFLGGNNTEVFGTNSAYIDSTGIYAAGFTYSSNYPVTTGAGETFLAGLYDAVATKLNPQGSALLYSTYLGGNNNNGLNGYLVASDGSLYLSGFTDSSDFPVTSSAFQRSYNSYSNEMGFVTHLSATFNSLVFSTYFGGSIDDDIFSIALDPSGNVYAAGITASADLPTTPGVIGTYFMGTDNEAFVTKFNPTGSGLVYSTYLGGSGDELVQNPSVGPFPPEVVFDYADSIAVDSSGYAYVAGVTTSCDFPTTTGAYQTANPCDAGVGYAVKLNTTGTALVYSTLLGGTTFDAVQDVKVDSTGSVMLAGVTGSSNFPTTTGAYSRTYAGGAEDGFAARLNPAGSALTYSTFFGGSNQEAYVVGDLASNGYVMLSGKTYSTNLPTTAGTFQPAFPGNSGDGECFLAVFDPTLSDLIDSTYLGGPGGSDCNASFATGPTDLVVLGDTSDTSFPTTAGAYQRTYAGGSDDFFIARFTLQIGAPVLSITKSHSGNFTQGQQGATYTVTVSNATGAGTTNQTVTVTEAVPSGLTLVSMAGSGWNCSANTCTTSNALGGGLNYPAITVTVNVAANASSPQVNSVSVSGGGSAGASANDSTVINTSVATAPALAIAKSHSGNFVQGQLSASYSVVVSNTGTASSSGTVTVTESVPSGLTLVSMSGTGWICGSGSCTRSDPLAPNGVYPTLTVTVNVAATAPSPQVNSVTVSGGNSPSASASDSTVIVNPACTSIGISSTSASYPPTGTSTVETCPNNSGQPNCGVLPETLGSFSVAPAAGCGPWTATSSNSEFLQITSGGSGTGSGTVQYALLNNTHNGQQSYSITVASGGQSAIYSVTEGGSGDNEVYRQVYALYEQLLGRDPDSGGFTFWTGVGGAELGQMGDDFLTSPEAYNSDFTVIAAYQAATGAAPAFAEFITAVSALRTGAQPLGTLLTSLEPAGYSATTMYENLLNRAPTASETSAYNTNGAVTTFENIIGYGTSTTPVGAPNNEFQSTGTFHTDHTNALYMDMLYFTILSRDPDPSGFAFWLGVANTGGPGLLFQGAAGYPTRIQILGPGTPNQGFIGSTEFQSLFAN